MQHKIFPNSVPYGEIQGYANGVPAYSNLHDGFFSGVRNIDEKIFTGYRWQCVEFARRWLLERKGLLLPDIDHAGNIYKLTSVEDVKDGSSVRMVFVPNNGTNKPVTDALLIYPQLKGVAEWGHVAVITEVSETFCRIADQNQHFHKWEGSHYSAELHYTEEEVEEAEGEGEGAVKKTVKKLFLEDKLGGSEWRPLGWMIFPDTQNRDPSVPLQWADKYTPPTYDRMRLERCSIILQSKKEGEEEEKPWLDVTNPAEKKFVETFGMDVSRTRLNEREANYYVCNMELLIRIHEASAELQRIFLEETEKVIASDELMARFKIPKEFWGRVRKSWETQPHSITARFDFVIDDQNNLKTFEYNADSASTLLECGRIQQKYAEHIGIADGSWGSGWNLENCLKAAWRRAGLSKQNEEEKNSKKALVHFCVDADEEEEYTALYAMEMAKAVGLECKLCVMFDEFLFNETGKVVDKEGNIVKNVWKTWMWESAFADYFKAKEERGEGWKPSPSEKVRLCDILLSEDDDVTVFEPMWKVIPSNKAILPMIYENNKDCPFILPASYELTEELKRTGYATKPIVGRIGENVTITSADGELLMQSEGRFGARDMVYQQKFDIAKRNEYYAILGGWMIGGEAAGISIREDKTIITSSDSPYSALRIWFDDEAVKKLSEENEAHKQY